jgi:DNA-binding transcriptional LysR family regulator
MARSDIDDLIAYLTVARERSFTNAAALLGFSQSALSHKIRAMEHRLGVRLLERTTRSVAPTEAGQRLLNRIGPHIDQIGIELDALSEFRDRPSGTIRISTGEHALRTVLWPRIDPFVSEYPDIKVELDVENGMIDIVRSGYDAGVRLGEEVAKDMIAIRIGPDWRMAVVAAPSYFANRKRLKTPDDLTGHNCINLRLVTYRGFYAWEFEKAGRRLNVRVEGQLAFNSSNHVLNAVRSGHGIGCVPEEMVADEVRSGALVQVLKDWMPAFEGYHLYYPSREHSAAFRLLVEAVRYRQSV